MTAEKTPKKNVLSVGKMLGAIKQPFSIEMRAIFGNEYIVILGGVTKIMSYKDNDMTFKCCSCIVSFLGEKLHCRSFQNGYIEIKGEIENINLR